MSNLWVEPHNHMVSVTHNGLRTDIMDDNAVPCYFYYML